MLTLALVRIVVILAVLVYGLYDPVGSQLILSSS